MDGLTLAEVTNQNEDLKLLQNMLLDSDRKKIQYFLKYKYPTGKLPQSNLKNLYDLTFNITE